MGKPSAETLIVIAELARRALWFGVGMGIGYLCWKTNS